MNNPIKLSNYKQEIADLYSKRSETDDDSDLSNPIFFTVKELPHFSF